MAEPVVCKVGELRLRDGGFAFAPAASSEFVVPTGKSVQVGLHYDYEESSVGKERTRVLFSFAVGDGMPVKKEIHIGDTPLVPDARIGFLSGLKKLAPGEHRGKFTVEADYGRSSWFGRVLGKSKAFRHDGEFVLRVR